MSREIDDFVATIDRYGELGGETSEVIPKVGVVRECDDLIAPALGIAKGAEYSFERKAYPAADNIGGRRTVFIPEPITIDNELLWVELKGYGQNGKNLFFSHHVEGDLFYGTYLENAARGYFLLKQASDLGLKVPQSVALAEFTRSEFFKLGLGGLRETMKAKMMFEREERIPKFWSKVYPNRSLPELDKNEDYGDYLTRLIEDVVARISSSLDQALKEGENKLLQRCRDFGIVDEMAGFFSKKPVGFNIRACRSPLRVGDPEDEEILTDRNRVIAREVGRTFWSLLANNLLHISPNTGNWTRAGELTDFEDVITLPQELDRLEAEVYSRGFGHFDAFFADLVGPRHTGVLSGDFIEGMIGRKEPPKKAAQIILETFF